MIVIHSLQLDSFAAGTGLLSGGVFVAYILFIRVLAHVHTNTTTSAASLSAIGLEHAVARIGGWFSALEQATPVSGATPRSDEKSVAHCCWRWLARRRTKNRMDDSGETEWSWLGKTTHTALLLAGYHRDRTTGFLPTPNTDKHLSMDKTNIAESSSKGWFEFLVSRVSRPMQFTTQAMTMDDYGEVISVR